MVAPAYGVTVTEIAVHVKPSRAETKRTRPVPIARPVIRTDDTDTLSTWSTFGASFRTTGVGHAGWVVIETVTEAPIGMVPVNGMVPTTGLACAIGWHDLSVAAVGR